MNRINIYRDTEGNISKSGHFLFEEVLQIVDVRHRSHVQDGAEHFSCVLMEEIGRTAKTSCVLKLISPMDRALEFSFQH